MTILDTAAKPYPKDYRQSPYYKSSFYLKLYHIFKKYNLKYDIETESIINLDTKRLSNNSIF